METDQLREAYCPLSYATKASDRSFSAMGIDFDSVEIILNSTGERNVIEKMVTDLVSQMEEEKLIDNSIREYYVYAWYHG